MTTDTDYFLAVDIGNSSVVLGFFMDSSKPLRVELPSDPAFNWQNYHTLLKKALPKFPQPRRAAVSCVVPSLLPILKDLIYRIWSLDPIVIVYGREYGIPIQGMYPNLLLGSDLFANTAYALNLYPKANNIILDLGTALTLMGVSAKWGVLGGTISLGIGTSLKALSLYTALLPEVPLELPEHVLSMNTIQCIQSGTLRGYGHLIEGLIKDIKREMKRAEPKVPIHTIATGGLSFLMQEKALFDKVDQNATLKGIKLLYERSGH